MNCSCWSRLSSLIHIHQPGASHTCMSPTLRCAAQPEVLRELKLPLQPKTWTFMWWRWIKEADFTLISAGHAKVSGNVWLKGKFWMASYDLDMTHHSSDTKLLLVLLTWNRAVKTKTIIMESSERQSSLWNDETSWVHHKRIHSVEILLRGEEDEEDQEFKRKTKEEVHGCREGGHEGGCCERAGCRRVGYGGGGFAVVTPKGSSRKINVKNVEMSKVF